MDDESVWLIMDEASDVAGSLRHAVTSFHLLETDAYAFKWAFLALHSALQGACVCHLTTTAAPVGAVSAKNAGEWLEYFEAGRTGKAVKPPKTYILELPLLLKKVRKHNSSGNGPIHADIKISDIELDWLKRLHVEVRNQLTHFEPMGWSIDIGGLKEFARVSSRIVSAILDAGWAFRHLDPEQCIDMEKNLAKLSAI